MCLKLFGTNLVFHNLYDYQMISNLQTTQKVHMIINKHTMW